MDMLVVIHYTVRYDSCLLLSLSVRYVSSFIKTFCGHLCATLPGVNIVVAAASAAAAPAAVVIVVVVDPFDIMLISSFMFDS